MYVCTKEATAGTAVLSTPAPTFLQQTQHTTPDASGPLAHCLFRPNLALARLSGPTVSHGSPLRFVTAVLGRQAAWAFGEARTAASKYIDDSNDSLPYHSGRTSTSGYPSASRVASTAMPMAERGSWGGGKGGALFRSRAEESLTLSVTPDWPNINPPPPTPRRRYWLPPRFSSRRRPASGLGIGEAGGPCDAIGPAGGRLLADPSPLAH